MLYPLRHNYGLTNLGTRTRFRLRNLDIKDLGILTLEWRSSPIMTPGAYDRRVWPGGLYLRSKEP